MPELPEVETMRRTLQQHLPGQKISRAVVSHRQLRRPIPDNLEQQLQDASFTRMDRRAKYLLMHTDRGCMIAHLGMSGVFKLTPSGLVEGRHNHLCMTLSGGDTLVFHDPRRFGLLDWTDTDPLQHDLLRHLGPEPLSEAFDAEHLVASCRSRTATIKSVLMDGKAVAGLGNIYACEALFMAGIRPHRKADTITRKQLATLADAIRKVLRAALRAGGSSIRDFKNADGKLGYFALQLQAYGRAGQPCPKCGAVLKNQPISGRGTVFCCYCQR